MAALRGGMVTLARLGEMEAARDYLRLSLDASVAEELTPDVVYALSGWALWLHLAGKTAVAAQLLSLAATHPASWHHERAEAQRLLAEVGGSDANLPDLTLETAVGLIELVRERFLAVQQEVYEAKADLSASEIEELIKEALTESRQRIHYL